MSAVLSSPAFGLKGARQIEWLIILLGFLAMYVPVYWAAVNGIWQHEDNGHGPIVAVVVIWLFWGKQELLKKLPTDPAFLKGGIFCGLGFVLYLLGRVFDISSADFLSQFFVVVGVVLFMWGNHAVKALWFPLLYLIFMVPLPGTLVDAITGPLKQVISDIVERLLYSAGYPIARSGVILQVGQYQLMVADACSGLHSMFSLSALGTLFMYIMARKSKVHNLLMLMSILPIAFVANIIRVIILVLVTYHLGDEAGQGFLHGAAGMVLMLAALVFFFALDACLAMLSRTRVLENS